MAQIEQYGDLVLGSGAGGKLLAWHLAQAGRRVAVVERRWVGGSCPNINCLPSKNEIWSAKVADFLHHAAQFGIVTGPVAVDMAKVRGKREMVEGLVAMHLDLYQKSGAELIMGNGRFVAPKTLEVRLRDGGTRVLTGERVFLNLGTPATIPPIAGLADAGPLTHIEALELDRLPAHLIVLGGGYVGLEFAQAYRRFGSRVTVVEHGPRLAGREDPDVADAIGQLFGDEGIDVVLSAEPLQVEGRSGEDVRLRVRTPRGERLIEGSDILAATGRTPNTAGIGLDTAGVRLDERGYVQVNDRLETSAPDVWAIGECAGSPQFTHVSEDDFRVIRDNLAGGNRTTRDRLIPFCLFTDPPLARVGLSEAEAQRRGVAVRVAKLPMAAVLRTRTTGETRGFMKALVDARTDRILGFTMFGPEAGEVMAVVQTAMLAGMPYTGLRDAIFAHPTMAEGLNALFFPGAALARRLTSEQGPKDRRRRGCWSRTRQRKSRMTSSPKLQKACWLAGVQKPPRFFLAQVSEDRVFWQYHFGERLTPTPITHALHNLEMITCLEKFDPGAIRVSALSCSRWKAASCSMGRCHITCTTCRFVHVLDATASRQRTGKDAGPEHHFINQVRTRVPVHQFRRAKHRQHGRHRNEHEWHIELGHVRRVRDRQQRELQQLHRQSPEKHQGDAPQHRGIDDGHGASGSTRPERWWAPMATAMPST